MFSLARATTLGTVVLAAAASLAIDAQPSGPLPPTGPVVVVNSATEADAATLYNSAQARFAAHDATGGLADLERVLAITPNDAEALALQAIWAEQANDPDTRDAALNHLANLDPAAAQTARDVINGVDAAARIVPSTSPAVVAASPIAIVILGHGLREDGTMAPELVKRLTAGLAQAYANPGAPIYVSGGAPKRGITEAAAMQQWLLDHGVPESRITSEDRSTSTVANAQNTTRLLQQEGIDDVILVTSPSHVRRAAANFAATGTLVVGTTTTDTDLAAFLAPYTKAQQAGLRLEATRAAGIPKSKQVPGPPATGTGSDGFPEADLLSTFTGGSGSLMPSE
ncbi:YdcF family protein [Hoyosella sp. G463]|uniref:YdcF family protein n=1 Tax=Lolliginicoccus lacisalsi TaxID=2742202 RepID=A0A927PLE2_9ACTN|nr:YdcF family protein [Lolliginicoccus lacisalsi]MBD8506718.1 YdcF family protein [Lolliginicoccus lacisalsi]